jgi:hypothetical protein
MSVSILVAGGLSKPAYKKLTNTSQTVVYTATQKQERVVSAIVVNDTAGAIVCKLIYTDTTLATDVIYWEKSVAANAAETVDFPVRLLDGDKIQAIGNNNVNIILAVLIDNGPLGGLLGG